jgi:hypothetical protein
MPVDPPEDTAAAAAVKALLDKARKAVAENKVRNAIIAILAKTERSARQR